MSVDEMVVIGPPGRCAMILGLCSGRGISIHPLHNTAINDAIRNGDSTRDFREFAGHCDIRTTEVYFLRGKEETEVAARRMQFRLTGSRDQ